MSRDDLEATELLAKIESARAELWSTPLPSSAETERIAERIARLTDLYLRK